MNCLTIFQNFSETLEWNDLQAVKLSMYLRKRGQIIAFYAIIYICYFKVIEGQVTLSTLFGTPRVCVNSSFFRYFNGLDRYTFKALWGNLHHRYFSFSQNQLFRYVCLSVSNCSLVENILDNFWIAQTWCDHAILRMFTVIKCRGYINFDLSKIIWRTFSINLQFSTVKVIYQEIWFVEKVKNL